MKKHKNFIINKLYSDKFNRRSGIFCLRKPVGITSHDLVDQVRKRLKTKKVGHTGALDPFASGLMIILVGKATKCAQAFLHMDKEYECQILLGIATDTQDSEGKIIKQTSIATINKKKLTEILHFFVKTYTQHVPVFSSVKIDGLRLRELAHAATDITQTIKNNDKYVSFSLNTNSKAYKKLYRKKKLEGGNHYTVKLPKRSITVYSAKLLNFNEISHKDISGKFAKQATAGTFQMATITVSVSKGTYIRQLAEDIGKKLGIPSMLYALTRTKLGPYDKSDMIDVASLSPKET